MCIARRFIIWPWPAPLLHSVKKFKLTFQIVQWTFKSEIMEVGSDDKVKAAYDGESTIYRTPVSTQHTHLTSLWPGLWGVKLQKMENNPQNPRLIHHPSVQTADHRNLWDNVGSFWFILMHTLLSYIWGFCLLDLL